MNLIQVPSDSFFFLKISSVRFKICFSRPIPAAEARLHEPDRVLVGGLWKELSGCLRGPGLPLFVSG